MHEKFLMRASKWAALATVTVLAAAGCATSSQQSVHPKPAVSNESSSVKRVVFIGDSITGGWGFETDNYPIAGNLLSLKSCAQDPPPMDACTNSEPGAANRSVDTTVPPWVAYPYQFQSMVKDLPNTVPVYNYAVSGATPAMWDPAVSGGLADGDYNGKKYSSVAYACNTKPTDMSTLDITDPKWDNCDPNLFPGLFGTNNNPQYARWNLTKLPQDDSTLTVFTLGANPLMSRYLGLDVTLAGGLRGADTKVAADAAATGNFAALDANFDRNIKGFRLVEHLTNVLVYLADRGPVMLQKIYPSCPGMLGNLKTRSSVATTDYATCEPAKMKEVAKRAVSKLNLAMDQAVADAKQQRPDAQITSICPGDVGSGDCIVSDGFAKHPQFEDTRAYGGSFPANNPWVLSNDTGIHPNAAGHRYLAAGVVEGACREYQLFCDAVGNDRSIITKQWWPVADKSCRSTYYCAFASVRNNTDKTWKLTAMTQSSKDPTWATAGEWILLPPNEVKPGESMRYAIQSLHSGGGVGAKGSATYTIDGTSDKVQISTEVGFFSNSWDLSTTNNSAYSAAIDNNISKKKGSEEILNGTVTRR